MGRSIATTASGAPVEPRHAPVTEVAPWRLPRPLGATGAGRTRADRSRGQSIAEFAVILPVLLALLGATLDLARIFQAQNTLQAATRNAAEYVAAKSSGQTYQLDAAIVLCRETAGVPGYVASATAPGGCTTPAIDSVTFGVSTDIPGASMIYPIATTTVTASLPFRTFFPYPFLTQNGAWTIRSTQRFELVQGR